MRLEGQPLTILQMLLERPGELVTREELRNKLWPGETFVDFEHSLNAGVKRLRAVLGDSAEQPRYIETQARRGYRFIGELGRPLERVEAPAKVEITVEPDRVSDSRKFWRKVAASVLTIATLVLAAGVIYRRPQHQRPQEQVVLTAVPFTALPGRATAPAFSPDGSRIAFAWDGDLKGGGNGFDLYVKAIGSETLLRLTQHPSEDLMSAAWSPDGTQIAFQRVAGADSGIYVIPALGGPERKLHSTRVPLGFYETISWSPDAKWIAFSDWLPPDDHTGIYLLSPDTGKTERIPNGPKCLEQIQPAFSHRGEYLAYWCSLAGGAVLYLQPVQGGEPKMVSTFRDSPAGLTWSADDKELIYSLWGDGLSRVTVADGSVKTLAIGAGAVLPTVSPKGDKLGYSAVSFRPNIWRKDLLHPESPAVAFIPSSRSQFDAQYSPDGNRIAFASLRSGIQGVWTSNEDGSNLVQISTPAQASGSPQWSPDGNKIAFDSRSRDGWEIYVADVAERVPRKLVTNISAAVEPHWSRDGKWIYFTSGESARMGVYRCPASGGEALLISKDVDGFGPQGVLRWEDSIFCKPRRQIDAQESGSVGAARHGIRSEWIASPERRRRLEPLSRRYLFCSRRCAQISPLL